LTKSSQNCAVCSRNNPRPARRLSADDRRATKGHDEMSEPITPKKSPEMNTGRELFFHLFDVEIPGGNPATLVSWNGKIWQLYRTDSEYMQAVYRERQP